MLLTRLHHAAIICSDYARSKHFYTEVLGFVKKADFSKGQFRWLTVAPP